MQKFRSLLEKGLEFLRSIYFVEEAGQRQLNRLAIIFSLVIVGGVGATLYFISVAIKPPVSQPTSAGTQAGTAVAGSNETQVTSSAGVASTPTPAAGQAGSPPTLTVTAAQPTPTVDSGLATATQPAGASSPTATPPPAAPTRTPTNPQAAATFTETATQEGSGAATLTPTQTLTPTITVTPQPVTVVRTPDGMRMIKIAAGPFIMGTDVMDDPTVWYGEAPQHQVNLDAYFIDETEVTNAMYALCVTAGACTSPELENSATRTTYYDDLSFANYPVLFVDWSQATAYCRWVGGRLPSEAEWEKAARGTDARLYPWGETIACTQANYAGCQSDTTAVGSYPEGKSPYGVQDMAGNVYEWVNDWMEDTYYSVSPVNNPPGPTTGVFRVLRGGSWASDENDIRASARGVLSPEFTDALTGFRCARNQ